MDSNPAVSDVVSDTEDSFEKIGFFCDVCDCTLMNSITFLDHVNSPAHEHNMGASLPLKRSILEEVRKRLIARKERKSLEGDQTNSLFAMSDGDTEKDENVAEEVKDLHEASFEEVEKKEEATVEGVQKKEDKNPHETSFEEVEKVQETAVGQENKDMTDPADQETTFEEVTNEVETADDEVAQEAEEECVPMDISSDEDETDREDEEEASSDEETSDDEEASGDDESVLQERSSEEEDANEQESTEEEKDSSESHVLVEKPSDAESNETAAFERIQMAEVGQALLNEAAAMSTEEMDEATAALAAIFNEHAGNRNNNEQMLFREPKQELGAEKGSTYGLIGRFFLFTFFLFVAFLLGRRQHQFQSADMLEMSQKWFDQELRNGRIYMTSDKAFYHLGMGKYYSPYKQDDKKYSKLAEEARKSAKMRFNEIEMRVKKEKEAEEEMKLKEANREKEKREIDAQIRELTNKLQTEKDKEEQRQEEMKTLKDELVKEHQDKQDMDKSQSFVQRCAEYLDELINKIKSWTSKGFKGFATKQLTREETFAMVRATLMCIRNFLYIAPFVCIIISHLNRKGATKNQTPVRCVDLNKKEGEGFGMKLKGAIIKEIIPGGAAELEGQLKAGDVIIAVGATNVESMNKKEIPALIRESGETVRLWVR